MAAARKPFSPNTGGQPQTHGAHAATSASSDPLKPSQTVKADAALSDHGQLSQLLKPEQDDDPLGEGIAEGFNDDDLFNALFGPCPEEPETAGDVSTAKDEVIADPCMMGAEDIKECEQFWEDLFDNADVHTGANAQQGGGSSSSTSMAMTPETESQAAPDKKQYPTGTQKKHVRPAVLKQLDCPGGTISLDHHAHRFTVALAHHARETSKLVVPYTNHGFSKVFGAGSCTTWKESLRECHAWMWTKYQRLHPKSTKTVQTPGSISDAVYEQLVEAINNLGPKVAYGSNKKALKEHSCK